MSHALALSAAPRRIEAETPADAQSVEALIMAAFGPGRFAKTAERLREGSRPVAGFLARQDGRVIGSVRLWPVTVGVTHALFLGPIAVDKAVRSEGLGAELVQACVRLARETGVGGVLLVGDRPYFERFGFLPAPGAVLPGPADPKRVLWLATGVETVSGPVRIG